MIKLKLKKCHGKEYCKSEKEIEDFFRNKFIFLVYNRIRFDSSKFKEDSIIYESVYKYIPVSFEVSSLYHQQFSMTEINLQDELINYDELTEYS